jgi:hypothetical protein
MRNIPTAIEKSISTERKTVTFPLIAHTINDGIIEINAPKKVENK